MLKKLIRWWGQARSNDNVVIRKPVLYLMQLRVVALMLVLAFTYNAAQAGGPLGPEIDMAQGRACLLPRMEGELTLAVIFRGELLCWVMR